MRRVYLPSYIEKYITLKYTNISYTQYTYVTSLGISIERGKNDKKRNMN